MSDKNWRVFWNKVAIPETTLPVGESVFLKQVGMTVGGKPISQKQLRQIIADIIQNLEVHQDDRVLDLCCGNGLITRAIAEYCAGIVGVDFSEPLLSAAREHHCAANVEYVHSSVFELDAAQISNEAAFTKVYMYAALQYFKPEEFSKILRLVLELSVNDVRILFGGVPDRRRKWQFYNTPRRKLEYAKRVVLGQENLGTWWGKEVISRACKQLGLACEFLPQHPTLHTAHYRFDVLIDSR